MPLTPTLADQIRSACAHITAGAVSVRVVGSALETYADELPEQPPYPPPLVDLPGADLETRAGLVLALDAVNFGSGWFPTLQKREGMSGSLTVMHGIRDAFPWTVEDLCDVTPERVAQATGQDPDHELMALYATALRELGSQAARRGGFAALATLPGLAAELSTWPTFADPGFFKRAQITAYDGHPRRSRSARPPSTLWPASPPPAETSPSRPSTSCCGRAARSRANKAVPRHRTRCTAY